MRKISLAALLIVSLSIVWNSCSTDEYCISDVVAYLKMGFYSWENGEKVEMNIQKLIAYGCSMEGLPYDSILNKNKIELPLSNLSDTSCFVLQFEVPPTETDSISTTEHISDTLTIIYSRRLYLISPVCGFSYDYDLRSVSTTNNHIDSINIEIPVVTITEIDENENIEVLL